MLYICIYRDSLGNIESAAGVYILAWLYIYSTSASKKIYKEMHSALVIYLNKNYG